MNVPSEIEQIQIGSYFQNLDALIALHRRKHDKLLAVKKAMLEKMFPQEGADVPEIRFKGFAGKWERRKYCKVFTILANNTLSRADLNYSSGIARNIHYGDVLIKFCEFVGCPIKTQYPLLQMIVYQKDLDHPCCRMET